MPKQAMNYANAVIYKIVCNDLTITDCYVGSTTNFTKRKNHHKCSCNNENEKHHSLKIYQVIRANGGWNNWTMVLVEEYSTSSCLLLEQRERYWIETLSANLNCKLPSRTKTEYIINNNALILKNKARYYQLIKNEINAKIECICGCFINKGGLKRHQNSNKHIDAMVQLHSKAIE